MFPISIGANVVRPTKSCYLLGNIITTLHNTHANSHLLKSLAFAKNNTYLCDMELIPTYIDHLKRFEGFSSEAYLPKGEPASGYLTIGYGTRLPRTKALALSPMDEQEATYYLQQSLSSITKFVRSSLQAVPYALSDTQFTALVDFCYNCGVGAYERSTLYQILRTVRFTDEDLHLRPHEEYKLAKVEAI